MTSTTLNGTARTEAANAESRMPFGIQGPNSDFASEPEPTNREIVDDAFSRACYGNSITPERLFIEARWRGLSNDEVREVLMDNEAVDWNDDGYKAARTEDGQYFIQCSVGYSENASMRELLSEAADEIETPKAVRQNFHVADELRAKGIELNEREAVLMQTCHTLSKGFRSGTAIPTSSLKRVLVQYHPEHFERLSQVSSVLNSLACRKVVHIGNHQVRLREPLKASAQRSPTKWARLTDEPELEDVLIACADCMDCGFKNRNVVNRHAVRCLLQARHSISTKEISRRIRTLIEAGILETTISKGAQALRLTVEASSVMRRKASELKAAEPKGIAKDETLNRYDHRNGCHIEAGRKGTTNSGTLAESKGVNSSHTPAEANGINAIDTLSEPFDIEALRERYSDEAERQRLQSTGNFFGEISTEAAIVYHILHQTCSAIWCTFEQLLAITTASGMDGDDLMEAMRELNSREMIMPHWCKRSQTFFIELNAGTDHSRLVSMDEGLLMQLQAKWPKARCQMAS